nr:hypothetical protein Iba_chr14eCG7220 [Ipomoea batatas]
MGSGMSGGRLEVKVWELLTVNSSAYGVADSSSGGGALHGGVFLAMRERVLEKESDDIPMVKVLASFSDRPPPVMYLFIFTVFEPRVFRVRPLSPTSSLNVTNHDLLSHSSSIPLQTSLFQNEISKFDMLAGVVGLNCLVQARLSTARAEKTVGCKQFLRQPAALWRGIHFFSVPGKSLCGWCVGFMGYRGLDGPWAWSGSQSVVMMRKWDDGGRLAVKVWESLTVNSEPYGVRQIAAVRGGPCRKLGRLIRPSFVSYHRSRCSPEADGE